MNTFQRELNNLQHRQQLLYILLFSFATVIVWIGVSLLSSQQRTGIPPEVQLLATPLNPTINLQVLNDIRNKRAYTDQELTSFPIYKVVSDRQSGGTQIIDISQPTPVETTPLTVGTEFEETAPPASFSAETSPSPETEAPAETSETTPPAEGSTTPEPTPTTNPPSETPGT